MAIEIDGKIYRNLQEQVAANKKALEEYKNTYIHRIVIKDTNYRISLCLFLNKSTPITEFSELIKIFKNYGVEKYINATGGYNLSHKYVVYAIYWDGVYQDALQAAIVDLDGSAASEFLIHGSSLTVEDFVQTIIGG